MKVDTISLKSCLSNTSLDHVTWIVIMYFVDQSSLCCCPSGFTHRSSGQKFPLCPTAIHEWNELSEDIRGVWSWYKTIDWRRWGWLDFRHTEVMITLKSYWLLTSPMCRQGSHWSVPCRSHLSLVKTLPRRDARLVAWGEIRAMRGMGAEMWRA